MRGLIRNRPSPRIQLFAGLVTALLVATGGAWATGALPLGHAKQESPRAARAGLLGRPQIRRLVRETGIPAPYWRVDVRTAEPVFLGEPLTTNAPIFPGDPTFTWKVWTTVPESGYLLEHITSLGTHTGTHISAPCHFHVQAICLRDLPESFFAPRPLVVVNVAHRISSRDGNGDFFIGIGYLERWEQHHGHIPPGAYVVLYTGLSKYYRLGNERRPGLYNDYFDDVPGFSGRAVRWLFEERSILGVGADTFGPDATMDGNFAATTVATAEGGITLENLGPSLGRMRSYGDWIEVNGPRYATTAAQKRQDVPGFSGAQTGMTGFTHWR